jgi:hypothetical protein
MPGSETTIAVLPAQPAEASPEAAWAQIVTIVSVGTDNLPHVAAAPGEAAVAARLAVHATPERLRLAAAEGHRAVVVFEHGDRTRPLIVGLIEPAASPAAQAASGAAQAPEALSPDPQAPRLEADVDCRRVRLTAQDEIVLQCGSASVTLRRNGRVVIRGTYVETHSEGTNRIKGGQVQIN